MTARLLDENQRRTLGILAAAAAAVLAAGLLLEPRRAWSALLMANFFFVCVALGGLVFAAIQRLSSAGWSALFCRVPEAMGAYLPVGAALMALQCFGVGKLYPWADSATVAADPVLRAKTAFLNPVSFFIISAVCFAVWY
ncbi:MAG: hypothetical protein KGK30_08200, partial [Elusimicrobia bacterium]|nr:hypothetical protein [Elusimicrobiota bacterium]